MFREETYKPEPWQPTLRHLFIGIIVATPAIVWMLDYLTSGLGLVCAMILTAVIWYCLRTDPRRLVPTFVSLVYEMISVGIGCSYALIALKLIMNLRDAVTMDPSEYASLVQATGFGVILLIVAGCFKIWAHGRNTVRIVDTYQPDRWNTPLRRFF